MEKTEEKREEEKTAKEAREKTEEREKTEAKKREEEKTAKEAREEMEEKEKRAKETREEMEEKEKIAREAKAEEPKIQCLMTRLNNDPREKTDCTEKQYGTVYPATDPRDMILQAVQPKKEQDLSVTSTYLNLTTKSLKP